MAKDFSRRVVSAPRGAGTTSGFQNDFVHIPAGAVNFQVTDKGGYSLFSVIVGTPPGSGAIQLVCGSDEIANITTTAARAYPMPLYLYDKLIVSLPDTTADVTIIVSKNVGK